MEYQESNTPQKLLENMKKTAEAIDGMMQSTNSLSGKGGVTLLENLRKFTVSTHILSLADMSKPPGQSIDDLIRSYINLVFPQLVVQLPLSLGAFQSAVTLMETTEDMVRAWERYKDAPINMGEDFNEAKAKEQLFRDLDALPNNFLTNYQKIRDGLLDTIAEIRRQRLAEDEGTCDCNLCKASKKGFELSQIFREGGE